MSARDKAAVWLGVASILSIAYVWVKGELHWVQMPKAGIPVALVLGLLAVAGGRLGNRLLVLLAGIGFLAAALVQLVLHTDQAELAEGSNGSTLGLWLGLGFGLLSLVLVKKS